MKMQNELHTTRWISGTSSGDAALSFETPNSSDVADVL
ncbi:Protein of unknown function [Pyronema omphalodes CBS 100304]|uniref:Uncharacterized protein n=1 Tax=Pyronema omphalodes (strain CBS 100304) TaxID=1076935 RepID=U4LNI4_PYROM|nr:Protein of unknown function [Pyronema omphalodes CBS 100304]